MTGYLNVVGVGNSLDYLKQVPDNTIDALVTDPPAGVSFMSKEWDSDKGGRDEWIAWLAAILRECRRVLKPGAHALVWSLPRTNHWTGMAIEEAGFEVKDCIAHIQGQGFPKSLDISAAIDARLGAERRVVGTKRGVRAHPDTGRSDMPGKAVGIRQVHCVVPVTAPATPEASAFAGYGTGLKPSVECWYLAQKPLEGTYVENVLKYGTGALNIDASRIGSDEIVSRAVADTRGGKFGAAHGKRLDTPVVRTSHGRWPTNAIFSHDDACKLIGTRRVHTGTAVRRNGKGGNIFGGSGKPKLAGPAPDHTHEGDDGTEEVERWECAPGCPIAELDAQSGTRRSGDMKPGTPRTNRSGYSGPMPTTTGDTCSYGDVGGASRFFKVFHYSPKATNKERWSFCKTCQVAFQHDIEHFKQHAGHEVSSHPTQKSLDLMKYLVRLVLRPGGVVLDPFCGTGTTAVAAKELGCDFVTCELDEGYAQIARTRLVVTDTADREAVTGGSYFCPGCRARGEINLISQAAVDHMAATGRKTTCPKCLRRYTIEELVRG